MSKNKLNFRSATENDIAILRELEQRVVEAERPFNSAIKSEGATYYDITDLISNENSFLLVVEYQGSIVGTGYSQIRLSKNSLNHEHHGYLGFMYVSPDFRGQGINKMIIEKLIDWTKTQDVSDFYLDVYAENTSAIRAYEKVGFKPCLLEMKLNLAD